MAYLSQQFFFLSILEKEPLSSKELNFKMASLGVDRSTRTTIRRIADLRQLGFSITSRKKRYFLDRNQAYSGRVMRLLGQWVYEDPALRHRITGDFSDLSASLLNKMAYPANTLYQLFQCVKESREIHFNYTPQTDQTRKRLKNIENRLAIASQFPVEMILHYIKIHPPHFLLLGEAWHSGQRRVRQYELNGIDTLQVKNIAERMLNINPEVLYQNSLETWLSDKTLEVTLFDKTKKMQVQLTVNGTDEIIQRVTGSLNNLQFVNPPEAIVQRMNELALPVDVFCLQKRRV